LPKYVYHRIDLVPQTLNFTASKQARNIKLELFKLNISKDAGGQTAQNIKTSDDLLVITFKSDLFA